MAVLLSLAVLLLVQSPGLEANAVVDLTEYTPEEFKSELENHDSIFIKFYTPSCPHCKSMAKDFALVARQLQEQQQLQQEGTSIVLAEVDCSHDAGEEVCAQFAITGFPSLKLFRFGSFYKNYVGQRNANSMKKWLLNQIEGSSRILHSLSHLTDVVRDSDLVTVSAVVQTGHMKVLSHFLKASKRVKKHPQFADLRFYHVIVDEVQSPWSVFSADKETATVTLHRPQYLRSAHELESVTAGLTVKSNITQWVFNQTYGVIRFRTPKSDRNLYDPRVVGPLVVAFYDFDFRNDSSFTHMWRDQILALVPDYPMFTFAISRSTDYEFYLKSKSLPIPRKPDPPVVIFYDDLTIPYAMNVSFSPQAMRSFLHEVMGPIGYPPQLRSSPKCPDHQNWTLTCLSGEDFKRLSLSVRGVILLIFKQVNDETMKLATKVGKFHSKIGNGILDFYAVDAALNEVPHAFETSDHPVLFYVSANKKVVKIERKFADILITELTRDLLTKSSKLHKTTRIKSEL